MDPILHSLIAIGCMIASYYAGNYAGSKSKAKLNNVVSSILDTLEKQGFIATVLDKDGDKELIPISELVAAALRETKK